MNTNIQLSKSNCNTKGGSQSTLHSSSLASSPSDVDAKLAESEDDDELEELEELLGSSVLLVSMGSTGSISLACEACAQRGH